VFTILDVLITNGLIVDGSGSPGYRANIGVRNGKIDYIGSTVQDAAETIDASGMTITPGFVDCHSHSDYSVLDHHVNPANCLLQGITTEIAGMCGGTPYPLKSEDVKGFCAALFGECDENTEKKLAQQTKDFRAFLTAVNKERLGTNMAFYIGHSSIRAAVMGSANRKPGSEEMEHMKEHVRLAMEEGALGLSSGLIYPPGAYADEDEIVKLCKIAAEYGGRYTSHMRNEGDRLLESIKEAISVGRKTGIPVNISHIKVIGSSNWGKATEALRLIDDANSEGLEVTADMYPYTAGATYLVSAIPPKHASEGQSKLIDKLKDSGFRRQLKEELANQAEDYENLVRYCGFDGIQVLRAEDKGAFGKTISDIARERAEDPFDVFCDLIIESKGSCFCAFFIGNCNDMEVFFKHPMVMGGTDGGANAPIFPVLHPRHTAAFPKLIKDFVIDRRLLSLEEAVRKLCGLPAQKVKLKGKGLLREGYDADILVLDYDNLDYTADYINPSGTNRGFRYVLVNGKVAVKDDIYTGLRNGRLLNTR